MNRLTAGKTSSLKDELIYPKRYNFQAAETSLSKKFLPLEKRREGQ
jgi:hypothetical protein